MKLETYRKTHNLSYEQLADLLGLTTNKVFRLCKQSACCKLVDAYKIVQATRGEVSFGDLLPDECI